MVDDKTVLEGEAVVLVSSRAALTAHRASVRESSAAGD
jgi:hypothetical protein